MLAGHLDKDSIHRRGALVCEWMGQCTLRGSVQCGKEYTGGAIFLGLVKNRPLCSVIGDHVTCVAWRILHDKHNACE